MSTRFECISVGNNAHPDSWTKWKKHSEHFCSASGLAKKDEPIQVNILAYAMSDIVEEIFNSLRLSEDDTKKHDTVTRNLEEHYAKQHNSIYNEQDVTSSHNKQQKAMIH